MNTIFRAHHFKGASPTRLVPHFTRFTVIRTPSTWYSTGGPHTVAPIPSKTATQTVAPIELLGLPFPEFEKVFENEFPELPKYRTRQLWFDLYAHVNPCAIHTRQVSALDKSIKLLLALKHRDIKGNLLLGPEESQRPEAEQAKVEAVIIPERTWRTLCVSSQIGCSLACSFCHTGTQKLLRNLTSGEIVGQVMVALQNVGDFSRAIPERTLKNIVFMGQGEPLYNYRNVRRAIRTLTHPEGLAYPSHRITVSTSGIAPLIPKLATELQVTLAISLHAPTDQLRNQLMPINKTYPIRPLLEACEEFSKHAGSKNRRITFEYVMLKGVNDSIDQATQLTRLLTHLDAHVNLIPFNPWPGSTFECSSTHHIQAFAEKLKNSGIHATVRWSKGSDILAACGQLRSNELLKSRSTA
ncbi:hypothetical protein IWQ62_001602 [Dispira parvispora]|uniref:Radical SAM core domain-containing protein n=1 Tax=Dispira parvispora TaxID=1520584 RepID=A0A9W8E8C9_9FUNG|nr:hypothetical protein IWQ62_001602 [Dispira parvispora]